MSRLLDTAQAQIGTPADTVRGWYNHYIANLGGGWPWCAAATGYICDIAGVEYRRSAWVPDWKEWARASGWMVEHPTPGLAASGMKPGDIVLFDWDIDGRTDHIEIVESVENGMVHSIGGNGGGSRDYIGRSANPVANVDCYLRLPQPTETAPPPLGAVEAYTVQAGDTLSAIGARHGVPWYVIAEVNGLADPNLIHPGQLLTIPVDSLRVYEVVVGDNLTSIADRLGVTVQHLVALNGIANPNLIHPGDKLKYNF